MTVAERITSIRLIEKIDRNPKLAEKLGLSYTIWKKHMPLHKETKGGTFKWQSIR